MSATATSSIHYLHLRCKQLTTPITNRHAMLSQTDASIIEQYKENIQPLPGGRSVSKLATGIKSASQLFKQHKEHLLKERQHFEDELQHIDDLDDPLQTFVDYIKWTHLNYPQGTNAESGLLTLLERCTSFFRDVPHYKNDPRYLKVWLEYTNYSDSPRDIFVYLAKKEIANQLSLYYEEFAIYLEINDKFNDARQIYELGIQSNARPLARLERSFKSFNQRVEQAPERPSSAPRSVLAVKRGESVVPVESDSNPRKRPKLDVFKDEHNQNQSVLYSIFNSQDNSNDLGNIKSRIKENVINPKQWSGEILKQRTQIERQPSSSGSGSKIEVFRDVPVNQPTEPQTIQKTETTVNGEVITIIQVPGKRKEKVFLNMDLIYPTDEEEYCFEEILAMSRRCKKPVEKIKERPVEKVKERPLQKLNYIEKPLQKLNDVVLNNLDIDQLENNAFMDKDITFTIPLRDDTTLRSHIPNSPTLTMFSRMANYEVANMFNDAAHTLNSEDEDERIIDNTTTTNFDGFVTETIHTGLQPQNLVPIETPPTDKEFDELLSSPFVDQPRSTGISPLITGISPQINSISRISPQIIDPMDLAIKNTLLTNLSIPLSVYSGYVEMSNRKVSRMNKFKENTNPQTKSINKGSLSSMIDFCGDEIYCLRHELGRGGYGFVYLIETGTTGEWKALKVESPSSKWEFYILNQIHRRLILLDSTVKSFFVKPESLYYFQDESYLIMDYCPQGTVLDVVNYYKNNESTSVDEVLCVYLAVELLKALQTLHRMGILHGDLKADNCMIRFEETDQDDEWSEIYSNTNAWSKKSITLIDFGRAMDLTLFDENVQFLSTWKADQQDCPQMNDHQPWTYEADYYGLAGIIHTMLFGDYIKVKRINNMVHLESPLKRYWQTDLWEPLFKILLNPYAENAPRRPLIEELRTQASRFQQWLETNSKSKNLKHIIRNIEQDLNKTFKKIASN